MILSMFLSQTASIAASWNATNSEWFVEVAVTVCLTHFQVIGALFLRKIYPICDLPEISSDLKPASAYPVIFSCPPLVYKSLKSSVPLK